MKYSVAFFLLLAVIACKQNDGLKPSSEIIYPSDSIKTKPLVDSASIQKKQTAKELAEQLKAQGFEIFNYIDETTKDTILMQQYFIAFLKSGAIRTQNEEEAQRLQEGHLAHLGKMYKLGYADISGPFGDDGDIRGITIYNVPTLKMADSLANADPMVKAGRLVVEVHPWWAAKGFSLR